MSAKIIQVDYVIEDVSSDSCRGRIIAQEDDDDIDLLAAIAKADCVVRNEYNR